MAIQAANPFGAFIAGRQARQAEEYGNTRNALAKQDLETGELRNRMVREQYSQEQIQRALQQTAATASRLAQSPNVRAELQQYPEFISGLRQQLPELDQMQDEELRQYLGFVAGQAQSRLGIGPAAPERYTLKPGEARYSGTEVVASRPAAEKPKGSEPLYQVVGPDGKTRYVPRSQAEGMSPPQPSREGQDFMRADKLRDEYNTASKDFIAIGDNYMRVREAARDPSAAGDLSLIFAYMKMLDPSSVVREQEFANAQNAAGVPDRIRNAWNKALNGERLNPNQRQDFINQANKVYSAQSKRHEKTVKARYTQMAQRFGVDPQNVVGAFDVPDAPGQESEGTSVREFATEAEAEAAGLKPGTRVKIGGVLGTWQ